MNKKIKQNKKLFSIIGIVCIVLAVTFGNIFAGVKILKALKPQSQIYNFYEGSIENFYSNESSEEVMLGGSNYNRLIDFSEGISVDGTTVIDGDGNWDGAITASTGTFSSTLAVTGAATFSSTVGITGVTTMGSSTSSKATITEYVSVALGDGSIDYLDFVGGDLYVQDDIEIDGNLYLSGTASSTSATTTNYAYIGSNITEPAEIDFTGGDLIVSDDAFINDNLRIGGLASTTGDLIVSGGTFDLTTTTATSSPGLFVRSSETSTSTISVGNEDGDGKTGCLEMIQSDGTYSHMIFDGGAANIKAGRCN